MKIARYGWTRDLPDHRDIQLYTQAPPGRKLPPTVDLRELMPPVYDQGELAACTANALASLLSYRGRPDGTLLSWTPSRMFLYYNQRAQAGLVHSDAGASIRDGIKSMLRYGACSEEEWPYETSRLAKRPPARLYRTSDQLQELRYGRVAPSLTQLRSCLAAQNPVIFGISLFSGMESDTVSETGMIPLPRSDENLLGGHVLSAVGYDDRHQYFIVRNSWGAGWGDRGYGYLPYAYATDPGLSADFWALDLQPEYGAAPAEIRSTSRPE